MVLIRRLVRSSNEIIQSIIYWTQITAQFFLPNNIPMWTKLMIFGKYDEIYLENLDGLYAISDPSRKRCISILHLAVTILF